jgi:hypothetical protein
MSLVARLTTFLVAFLAGGLGLMVILPFGLIAPGLLVAPLALAVGALLAALAGGWAATWSAGDGTRTRLGAAVAVTEATALAVGLVGLVTLGRVLDGPLAGAAAVGAVVLALAATGAATSARRADGPRRGDVVLTLALLSAAAAGVPAVLGLAGLAGLLGA